MDYDDVAAIVHIVNDVLEAEDQNQEVGERRFYLKENHFERSERSFIKNFRLTKDLVREVVDLVTPYVQPPSRRSALSIESKVLVSLLFYGHGHYQEGVAKNMFTALSQSSVSRCIHEVTAALNQRAIMERFVHFPRNINELRELRTRLFRKYALPGAVGFIDGTHVAIVPPNVDEHIYVNRKHYHSLNVQLVCDEKLQILNVNARFPGSSHDAFIWRQSQVSQVMERIYRNMPEECFFLMGDSGYPLRPWLMTPIENPLPDSPEERFNNRFKSARSTIERCNGLLKNRFRCLLKHRVLHYTPETAAHIINACVVLHNMCVQNNVPAPVDEDDANENIDFGMYHDNNEVDNELVQAINPDLAAARNLRTAIVANHFN